MVPNGKGRHTKQIGWIVRGEREKSWLLKIEEEFLLTTNQCGFDECQIILFYFFVVEILSMLLEFNKCQNHIGCKQELLLNLTEPSHARERI